MQISKHSQTYLLWLQMRNSIVTILRYKAYLLIQDSIIFSAKHQHRKKGCLEKVAQSFFSFCIEILYLLCMHCNLFHGFLRQSLRSSDIIIRNTICRKFEHLHFYLKLNLNFALCLHFEQSSFLLLINGMVSS